MKKELTIYYKNKKIKILIEDCNLLKKFTGLMFSRREAAEILLFSFRRKQKIKIHSLFVFYPFVAAWLDDRNNVVDLKKVKPFSFCVSPKGQAFKLVEIPIESKNGKLLKFLSPVGD